MLVSMRSASLIGLTRLLIGFVVTLQALAQVAPDYPQQIEWPIRIHSDLLDLHSEPQSKTDRSHEMFFDQGAWHGYALPAKSDQGTGFVGPFLSATGPGLWAGRRFATIQVSDLNSGRPIVISACDNGGISLPGALLRRACGSGITISETLFFASSATALVQTTITASQPVKINLSMGGDQFPDTLAKGDSLRTDVPELTQQTITGTTGQYALTSAHPLSIEPGKPATFYLRQTYEPASTGSRLQPWTGSPEEAWQQATGRWESYINQAQNLRPELQHSAICRRINIKAIVTLLNNWRAPLGDLHHGGLFPSYSNPDFNAFWAWDSWKHAAALAGFAPDLAKEQIRAIFDAQLPNGMVPDLVSRFRQNNNLRDTKPPLATWAVMKIYRETNDRQFVAEMFDKLYRYHRWWYADRDHDHNGLAEYGSTDGTRVAAAWESGMDNAARFDNAVMLKNSDTAWSLNQESVDLNSYLYKEKLDLARLADLLGKSGIAGQLRQEAAKLRTQIQQTMFDQSSGYFFDVKLQSRAQVHVFGPEGWIPLWTGVATDKQAQSVLKVLMDPQKFNTKFPFPTLARDDPRFAPRDGYWRGPVWIDQAAFAAEGMERYGFTDEANAMRQKLLANDHGLANTQPFFETYDPETGAGQNSRNFSWSAAHYFLLLHPSSDKSGMKSLLKKSILPKGTASAVP